MHRIVESAQVWLLSVLTTPDIGAVDVQTDCGRQFIVCVTSQSIRIASFLLKNCQSDICPEVSMFCHHASYSLLCCGIFS